MADELVTDVCIVSDPLNCPEGYTLINRTVDRKDDADLWKDSMLKKRTQRYLCIKTTPNNVMQGQDVLVNITLITEKDPAPTGYICLEFTRVTKEKALRKAQICVRYMNSQLTQEAVSHVVLGRDRKPPLGFILVGEINNLQLSFKLSTVYRAPQVTQSIAPTTTTPNRTNKALPYPTSRPQHDPTTNANYDTLYAKAYNPMNGVPFQLNPRLENTPILSDGPLPELNCKSRSTIEKEYSYNFEVENSLISSAVLSR